MAENSRIEELRRRVQADPASIAFAQLAEECRRTGSYEEAVEICRNGLASHPDYLSARITLGRALIELGSLNEAKHELDLVIATAPENLPAIRGLAEIFQRKGNLNESLAYFRRALLLAKHDVELEANVDRIAQRIELPVAPPAPAPSAPVSVEELFDFDKLLLELGEDPNKAPQAPQVPQVPQVLQVPQVPEALAPDDRFLDMERELRAMEEQRARDEEAARLTRAEEAARAAREEELARLAREEETARLAREEEELHARLAREEEELRAREEQERLAREEQERLAREGEQLRARLAREEEELRVREEERRRAEEAQRKADEEQRKADEERRLEEDLARQREEFEAQRRRDEEQRRRDEAERVRLAEDARRAAEQQRQLAVLAELEHWLDAIVSDRDHHASL